MPFYGLYIPVKGAAPGANNSTGGADNAGASDHSLVDPALVFRGKHEALDVLKLHKDARLREFVTEDDAMKYAQTGYEVVQSKYADVKTPTAALEKAAFRAPTKQELIEFRKVIEAGDCERVKNMIWDNPRYLVSSGDTPTTLKEGYRYNAMHVCAISKKPRVAELILQTVSDPKFVDLLTGKRNDQKMCMELGANLLDYYLNIPEKGRNETPLHFASKNGGAEMIEVLTSYAECKMTRNSEGNLPRDIICSRLSQYTPELYKKIEYLLEEAYYVPVLCSMDTATPPQIGLPFSASNPPDLSSDPLDSELKIQALAGPMSMDQAKQFRRRWKTPPRLGTSASSPVTNYPFISPMKSPMKARGNSSTPRRTPQGESKSFGSPSVHFQRRTLFNSTPQSSPLNLSTNNVLNGVDPVVNGVDEMVSFVDEQNGNHKDVPTISITNDSISFQMEANNNNRNRETESPQPATAKDHTNMLKTALCPKTPLLKLKREMFFTYREQQVDSPVVFGAPDNPDANDSSMSLSVQHDFFDTPGFKERHIKITDTEKGLEVIGRQLAKEQHVEWREYWDFLNAFIDIASSDGLQQLENYFVQRANEAEISKLTSRAMAQSSVVLDDVCNALEKFGFPKNGDAKSSSNGFSKERNPFGSNSPDCVAGGIPTAAPQTTTPYTCVEKSLQVFAKRITKTIVHNIGNVVSINDILLSELKRLKSLICSFKEDVRFLNVNFAKVHSRIGNLVSIYLEHSQEVTPDVNKQIRAILHSLLTTQGERREHIECVCHRIIFMLKSSTEQILPENLKTEDMCSKIWLKEKECQCQWENNLSRKTSRRNRLEARFKNYQEAKQLERDKIHISTDTAGSTEESSSAASCNESSDVEDDVFWSDFGGSDTEEEVWLTPPETPSRISLVEEGSDPDVTKIYIYGSEPTKRDLDVLNAIFHVNLDKEKYPHIHSWKAGLLCYPNDEMDYFPSPSVVKKSHSFHAPNSAKKDFNRSQVPEPQDKHQQQPTKAATSVLATAQLKMQSQKQSTPQRTTQQPPLPTAKRLFMSPSRAKGAKPSIGAPLGTAKQPPATPLNKIRGLFSAYRERLDNSPLSAMSTPSSGTYSTEVNSSDGGLNNLSLLNVSASE